MGGLDLFNLGLALERGGPIVPAILVLAGLMWCLIVERYLFQSTTFPEMAGAASVRWTSRRDRGSWTARAVRAAILSELELSLAEGMATIRVLIHVLPLMGLLGTVAGMIELFDGFAAFEGENERVVAAGVARAVLPTLTGMLAAVSGLLFAAHLERRRRRALRELPRHLPLTNEPAVTP